MPQWTKIRERLQASEADAIYHAVVSVGKAKAERLPDDVADTVLTFLDHPSPEIRAEARAREGAREGQSGMHPLACTPKLGAPRGTVTLIPNCPALEP